MINKYIMINLKSSLLLEDVDGYIKKINDFFSAKNIVFFPTSIYIPYFLNTKYEIGIQDVAISDDKNITASVTAKQAKSINIKYAILGHSDIEQTDEDINKKIKSSIDNKIKVVLCIGETLEERQMLKTYDILYKQIKNRLRGIEKEDIKNIFIAYEPKLSVGTNLLLKNEEISTTIELIKKIFIQNYDTLPNILYGGSVNSENINELNKINIDGFLIGSAAYDAEELIKICKNIK